MPESFGARLRQQRERQQITLAAIVDRTKVSLSLLEGLEQDDVSHWPGGIFRRSFIRAYAQQIGLDPDAVAREFLALHPDPAELETDDVPLVLDAESVSQPPPTRLRCAIASAIRSLSRSRAQAGQKDQPAPAMVVASPEVVLAEAVVTEAAVLSLDVPSVELTDAGSAATGAPAQSDPDLTAIARLCTELSQVLELHQVTPLLDDAAKALDARGLIVWVWDPHAAALRPALAHGYPDELLAKLPRVRRDADNATAAAFRSAELRIVGSGDTASGAVVAPLLTVGGCVGVLAVELRQGGEQRESLRALAAIIAAQLATVIGSASLAEAVNA